MFKLVCNTSLLQRLFNYIKTWFKSLSLTLSCMITWKSQRALNIFPRTASHPQSRCRSKLGCFLSGPRPIKKASRLIKRKNAIDNKANSVQKVGNSTPTLHIDRHWRCRPSADSTVSPSSYATRLPPPAIAAAARRERRSNSIFKTFK